MLLSLLAAKEMSMTVMHLDALVLARSGFHHSVNYRSATLFGTVKNVEDPIEKDAGLNAVILDPDDYLISLFEPVFEDKDQQSGGYHGFTPA